MDLFQAQLKSLAEDWIPSQGRLEAFSEVGTVCRMPVRVGRRVAMGIRTYVSCCSICEETRGVSFRVPKEEGQLPLCNELACGALSILLPSRLFYRCLQLTYSPLVFVASLLPMQSNCLKKEEVSFGVSLVASVPPLTMYRI